MKIKSGKELVHNTILLATTSLHKIAEFSALFALYAPEYHFITLNDLNQSQDDSPETGHTFSANSQQKSAYYWSKYQMPVLCDDSGLEVFNLDNFPGIYSKRWLEQAGFDHKIKELITMLNGKPSSCQYVCALTFKNQTQSHTFVKTVKGQLVMPDINGGFGFDIGFYLPQYQTTFSHLPLAIKNRISHRAQAFKAFIKWMKD